MAEWKYLSMDVWRVRDHEPPCEACAKPVKLGNLVVIHPDNARVWHRECHEASVPSEGGGDA